MRFSIPAFALLATAKAHNELQIVNRDSSKCLSENKWGKAVLLPCGKPRQTWRAHASGLIENAETKHCLFANKRGMVKVRQCNKNMNPLVSKTVEGVLVMQGTQRGHGVATPVHTDISFGLYLAQRVEGKAQEFDYVPVDSQTDSPMAAPTRTPTKASPSGPCSEGDSCAGCVNPDPDFPGGCTCFYNTASLACVYTGVPDAAGNSDLLSCWATGTPNKAPSSMPSSEASSTPTKAHSSMPSSEASSTPTRAPSSMPSSEASSTPTRAHSSMPSSEASSAPTRAHSSMPSAEAPAPPTPCSEDDDCAGCEIREECYYESGLSHCVYDSGGDVGFCY